MLGIDTMKSKTRSEFIIDSAFYQDLSDSLSSINAFSLQGKFMIEEFRIGADQTRLFDGEYV